MSAIDTICHAHLGNICEHFPVYLPVLNELRHCDAAFADEAQVDPKQLFGSELVFIGGGSGEFPSGGIFVDDALLVFMARSFSDTIFPEEWELDYFKAASRPIVGWLMDSHLRFGEELKSRVGPEFDGPYQELVLYTLGKVLATQLPSAIWPEGSVIRERHSLVQKLVQVYTPENVEWATLADKLFNAEPEHLYGKFPTDDPHKIKWGCGIKELIKAVPPA